MECRGHSRTGNDSMVSTPSPFRDAVADAATVNRSLDGLRGLAARPTLLASATRAPLSRSGYCGTKAP